MLNPDRRSFIANLTVATGFVAASAVDVFPQPATASSTFDWMPSQDPAVVKEMVGVSHADLKRVRELVEKQPALANASVDWGFGDWENALGAASHMGRRDIAEVLLANGAVRRCFRRRCSGRSTWSKPLSRQVRECSGRSGRTPSH